MSMKRSFVPNNIFDTVSENTHSISVVQETHAELEAGMMNNSFPRVLLFEKALTPSDVGKLNRLVIPKQYAEKYFPLRSPCGRSSSDESLLTFEDEFGKSWKFRYSYWTSSQSYVLTKGWSRYVKEKGIAAGDIVSFHRKKCHSDHTDGLFITWRTRECSTGVVQRIKYENTDEYWSTRTTTAFFPATQLYCPSYHTMNLSDNYTGGDNKMVAISSTPRRLRLFGVNMELDESDSSSKSSGVLTMNHGAAHQLYPDTPHVLKVFNSRATKHAWCVFLALHTLLSPMFILTGKF